LAESYVKEAGVTKPPVDPLEWCRDSEEIEVHQSALRGECDGLLVFRKGKFHLFYRPDPYRMRFTQAHEVAHYLIEEHHMAIRSGAAEHVCKTAFVTDSAMEREADSFAAGLLMPAFLFQPRCPDPNFAAIGKVARDFDVSFTAAILRTIAFTPLAAAVVVTVAGKIKWYFPSEEMAYTGVHTAKVGDPPPRNTKTAEVCVKLHSLPSEPIAGGSGPASASSRVLPPNVSRFQATTLQKAERTGQRKPPGP